jgi:hypothetical protein
MKSSTPRSTDPRPEDVGGMGQHYLGYLAKAAGLVANQAVDDKAGWDFELETASPTVLDYASHSKPIYRIQVKATAGTSNSVSMTFSSLLSLIRFPGPAFVFFVRFDGGGGISPVEAKVLHLDESVSKDVLRRMRTKEIELKSAFKINKATTAVSFKSAIRLDPLSGSELRALLERAIGKRYLEYVSDKARWLQQLERDSNLLRVKVLFEGERDVRAMADALLGYSVQPMVDAVSYVAPLGIPDEEPVHSGTFMPAQISPATESIRKVTVRLRAREYGATYTFAAKLYSNKGVVPERFAGVRIHGSMFDIRIMAEPVTIHLALPKLSDPTLTVPIRDLRNWAEFMGEVSESEEAETHLEVDPDDGTKPLQLSLATKVAVAEDHDDFAVAIDALYKRLDGLGLGDALIRPAKYLTLPGHLALLTHVGKTYTPEYSFEFDAPDSTKSDANTVIFRSELELDDVTVCYFAAFFGQIELRGGKALGKFSHSAYLDQVVIPAGGNREKAAAQLASKLEERLEANGYRVL